MEPVFSEYGYLNEKTSKEDIREIGKIAREEGLEIPSVGVWSLWKYNLVSNQEETRRRAVDIVKKQVEAAALLGLTPSLWFPDMWDVILWRNRSGSAMIKPMRDAWKL